MARTGWSSSNFLRYNSGLVTAVPLTIAGWGNFASTASRHMVGGPVNSASASSINCFIIAQESGGTVLFFTGGPSTQGGAASSTSMSAGTWVHMAGVSSSITSRAAYLNGGGKGTNATSETPTGINRMSFGVQDNTAAATTPMASGDMLAEWGLWNIALADADILELSTGMSPLLMHPESLVGYWPMIGVNSPENNVMSNTSVLSIQGSLSAAAHPRILMPSSRGKAA